MKNKVTGKHNLVMEKRSLSFNQNIINCCLLLYLGWFFAYCWIAKEDLVDMWNNSCRCIEHNYYVLHRCWWQIGCDVGKFMASCNHELHVREQRPWKLEFRHQCVHPWRPARMAMSLDVFVGVLSTLVLVDFNQMNINIHIIVANK